MKQKFLLMSLCLVGFMVVKASDNGPGYGTGKKDDINGSVVQYDNKKPLKDVSITAYLSSKKEKVVITDDNGNYAFDDLKPGHYKFIFEKEGFKKVTKDKVIAKIDEGFQLNIEMIENGDFDLMPSPFHFSN